MAEKDKPKSKQPEPIIVEPANPVEDLLSGNNPRGEVAGCPTGLTLPSRRKPEPPKKPDEESQPFKPGVEKLEGRQETGRSDSTQ
jgi:hypothetical protein